MATLYTIEDIKENLSRKFFTRAKSYFTWGRVREVTLLENDVLTGSVKGSSASSYKVNVHITKGRYRVRITGHCNCPVGFNCKHVGALLLAGLDKLKEIRPDKSAQKKPEEVIINDYIVADWVNRLEKTFNSANNIYPATVKKRLLYLLDLKRDITGAKLTVSTTSANSKKDGTFSSLTPYNPMNAQKPNPAQFLLSADLNILKYLTTHNNTYQYGYEYVLSNKEDTRLFTEILATKRCYWQKPNPQPLSLGEAQQAEITWSLNADGSQQISCKAQEANLSILPLSPPYYLDLDKHCCGKLTFDVTDEIAGIMLQAPAIKAPEAAAVRKKLSTRLKDKKIALPRLFEHAKTKKIKPAPHLHLLNMAVVERYDTYGMWMNTHGEEVSIPIARLSFIYGNTKIGFGNPVKELTTMENDNLVYIKRRRTLERAVVNELKENGFISAEKLKSVYLVPKENLNDFVMQDNDDNLTERQNVIDNWLRFNLNILPKLRSQGWQVEIEPDFPFNVTRPDDEWYADIDESSGTDWFGVELGVMVDGERLNLLPILLSGFKQHPDIFNELDNLGNKGTLFFLLPDGRQLALPSDRVKIILSFLKDLYNFENLEEDGKLKLSRIEAADLVEFEAAMKAVNLRWFGGERVKKLGQKLRDFKGIARVNTPVQLKTKLRNYQQEGLNWLQFLREYDLGGILADDMGLGKTVQTLAHIALEKENNRLDKPALVIAPTSVLVNLGIEAKRFTPQLKVLILHGPKRKAHYEKIKDHDLILTTYPLLTRDKNQLIEEKYHSIILDEAQYIKNSKAKVTQIVNQLDANYRLCLTGTQLENHLGELWSLFNFILPGLLGDEKQFRKFYRKPIEKEQDDDRRLSLVRRIKPFMLRRRKDMVAKELPPKTEIIQTSELAKTQRDLYETIRVSMHEKVRREIAKKGLSRSHIIVLDALLKLRQVCCDPRLMKLEAAKNIKQSAKLELLMDMLPELIEDGRRILLFSQFVSMLKLIEKELNKKKIEYVKLTGQTKDRQTPINTFQNEKVPLFLISLKAGGTGLNLTAADTVIHYDPWWNPAVETQATDRAHRIGQNKPVFVYKLITEGTVEKKILEMQERKRSLAEGIFNPNSKTSAKLTAEDINALFEPIGS